MGGKKIYKKQEKVAFIGLLLELPNFFLVLISAIVSGSLIVWMDAIDSFGYVLRGVMVTLMSKKLCRDLRYEYNYGIGKVESIAALLCDGIIFSGLIIMLGFCFIDLINPGEPGEFLLPVILLKLSHVFMDASFVRAQWKIVKENGGPIAESTYASFVAALLFDATALISLFIVWLLRGNPMSWWFSPVVGIFLAIYLMIRCIKRFKAALDELTDKTLPEEMQMKILKVMTRYYDQYSQLHFVKSHKMGDTVEIDFEFSFEDGTTYEQMLKFREQLQMELSKLIDNCSINIILR